MGRANERCCMNFMSNTNIRRFCLQRDEDVSGISGTDLVAEGVQFTNGKCALTWMTFLSSVAIYENIKILEAIHGHEGKTKVIFLDE